MNNLENTLTKIKAELICPLSGIYPNKPIISICCGKIYDSSSLWSYFQNLRSSESLLKPCPNCQQMVSPAYIFQQNQHTSLSTLVRIVRAHDDDNDNT